MIKKCFAGLMLALALFSCTKDELTRPVQTELVLEMTSPDNEEQEAGLLKVTGGRFMITEVGFDGYRENGENYFFSRQFPDSLPVTFSKSGAERIITFEMPQGVYSRIEIKMDVPSGKESNATGEAVDRSSLKGGVEVWGTYSNARKETIPFLFVYSSMDSYKFTAKDSRGQEEVVVKDKAHYKARLQFNPLKWMELINPRMLQSAKTSLLDGVPTIIISRTQNDHIYNLLANRIEKSANLNIE
jgi:hypothetical protein